jgi:hypothetical protein
MKALGLAVSAVVISMAAMTGAQNDAPKAAGKPAPTEAEKSFNQLKALSGNWAGKATAVPKIKEMHGDQMRVSLRVTSTGHAIMHEMWQPPQAGKPAREDDPITMMYVDGDRLLLTHYCDAGNRPRMEGKVSPDGKTVEFQFVDLSGGTKYGHMDHAVFTIIDANHHTEDWTYLEPGDKPIHAHMDLVRMK